MLKSLSLMVVLSTLFFSQSFATGCVKGDCYNGYGTYQYPSGARYVGYFTNGKAHGKGILYFSNGNKYIGHWQENKREGTGRLVYREGHEFRGEFKYNKRNGQGRMNYSNGDSYNGNWKNDYPNGKGTYSFESGDRYEGNFVKGRFEGEGVMFYADGSRFEGIWENNKKHGEGVFYFNNGRQINGEWETGKFMEDEKELEVVAPAAVAREEAYPDESARSSLRNCNRVFCNEGQGAYTYADGSRYEGSFRNGFPEGHGTTYYANKDKYVGQWKDHAPHGRGVMYFAHGRVLGAQWHYGKATAELPTPDKKILGDVVHTDESADVKIWAVVVGIGNYNHMPSLRYTDDDAYQFYAFLKSPEGGALPDDQLRILIDENATRRRIVQNMRDVLLKADNNDVVLFYFSGHGLEGSFVPFDFDGFNNKLLHSEIKKIMDDSKAKHKLVLGDACHSGSLLAMKAPVHATIKRFYSAFNNTKGGMALMMSSKGEEVSLEDGGLRSGIFSYYMIKGLKGAADYDKNLIVTVEELYNYVYSRVRSYTANAQSPTLTGDYDPNMPIAVIRH